MLFLLVIGLLSRPPISHLALLRSLLGTGLHGHPSQLNAEASPWVSHGRCMPWRTVGTACAWRGIFLFRYLSQWLQESHPPSFPGRKPSSASFVPDVVSAVFRERAETFSHAGFLFLSKPTIISLAFSFENCFGVEKRLSVCLEALPCVLRCQAPRNVAVCSVGIVSAASLSLVGVDNVSALRQLLPEAEGVGDVDQAHG